MKKQRYIVEIEMPDGDFISAGWLKELIQTDCDVEDESRKKVTVQETSLPSNLDAAAEKAALKAYPEKDALNKKATGHYDPNYPRRKAYQQGYEQAEKDLGAIQDQ